MYKYFVMIVNRLKRFSLPFFAISLLAQPAYAAEQDGVWRYAFRPGDNLIHFSKKHLAHPEDWKVVQIFNRIKNPERIPVGTVIEIPLHLVKFKAANVSVLSVSGDCYKKNNDGNQTKVNVGETIPQGVELITKEKSQLVIQFADGSTSQLNSNASLLLDTLSLYSGGAMVDTKVRLQKGQLETHANPGHKYQSNMNVQTPSAIAAVRGTKFRVDAQGEATLQETLEGGVDVRASGQVIKVAGGYGTKAKKGEAPQAPVKLLPAINTGLLKREFKTIPVEFELPTLEGAAKWQSQVAKDGKFNQVVAEVDSTTQKINYNDLADGTYFLKVRAKDDLGIAGYDATHRFVVNARPFAPDVSQKPINFKGAQPQLNWNPVDGAIAYMVQVSPPNGETPFSEKTNEPKLKMVKPLAEGEYTWRVAALAETADGKMKKSEYSKLARFQYIAPPPVPDISSLDVKVVNNRVYVRAALPIKHYQYHAVLNNPKNAQEQVWLGTQLPATFDFLLKEYGKQTLEISYVDQDGMIGPAAIYEFDAYSTW